ncbi:MAG TPA: thioredoxin domain-containing protein [Candidatus Dormibacteraeota bacterium]|nr:thioredoxin domain-containing protein [Candidatus Dormibacteraeota bacterium]
MSKQFWGAIIVVLAILIGVFSLTHQKPVSSNTNSQPTQHIEGQGKKGVTLIEYGDYQCPYCEEYYSTVKQVEQQNDQNIFFQFRNFPLTSIHQNAFAGARAAEAAALQGKFWQMHDALYDVSIWQQWTVAADPTAIFDQLAQQLGLNVTQFKQDYGSDKVNSLINADMAAGNKLGINGTPSFFLDGKQIQVANDPAAFQKLIDAEIANHSSSSH